MTRGFFGLAILAILLGSAVRCPAAGELTLKYFRELRTRRLYSVAERACLTQLSRPRLTSTERADLSIELADTLVEHASYVGDREQAEMWSRARQVLAELLERDPHNPRALLLDAHLALIPAAEAHWCRWQAEILPADTAWADQAQRALERALPKLLEVERQLAATLRANRKDLPPDSPRPFELRALLANVSFRRAQALVDQALLSNTPAADRSAALVQAEKLLRTLSESNEGEEILWNSRVLNVQCLRLMGDAPRALRTLTAYEAQTPPPDAAERLLAERVRLLQLDQPGEAIRRLDAAIASLPVLPGELAYLKTRSLADKVRDAVPPERPRVMAELKAFVERAQREVGGFWSYRCELVRDQVQDELKYGLEIAPLVRSAEAAFRRGDIPGSLAAYETAIQKSGAAGRATQAFDLGYVRASVAVEGKRWADAVAGLTGLLDQQPAHSKAPEASLLRAYALGMQYEEKPTQSRREEFTSALESHRKRFAGHPTTADATWMLAELEERRNQITSALKLYGEIPVGHPRGPEARLRQARCYPQILARLRELKRPADAWEQEAVAKLQEMLPAQQAQALDATQVEIALILADIQLSRAAPAYRSADELLARIFVSLPKLPPVAADSAEGISRQKLEARAMRLRVVSLAGQGQPQLAQDLLKQLSATKPVELLRIVEALAPVSSQVAEGAQADLGRLQLQAALLLEEHRNDLSPGERRRLDESLARAYLATDQSDKALAIYAQLAKSSPADKALLKAQAELLQKSTARGSQEQALALWRKLESLEKPGTPEWLACRLQVCTALASVQKTADCRKLLKTTRLLYPKLGTPELAKQFEALEKQVGP